MITAHIFLPMAGKSDFFFLSTWKLFGFVPQYFVYDLTWDEGKTFLLRDHYKKLEISRYNNFKFRSFFRNGNLSEIKKIKAKLLKLCQCKTIKFVKLRGSLADHFLQNEPLKIVGIKEL